MIMVSIYGGLTIWQTLCEGYFDIQLFYVASQQPYEVSTIITSLLQMRKLRPKITCLVTSMTRMQTQSG